MTSREPSSHVTDPLSVSPKIFKSDIAICDNLKGWGGVGGYFKREEIHIYLRLIHVDVWQKPTQHCKTIILQLKINQKSDRAMKWTLFFFICLLCGNMCALQAAEILDAR